MVSMWVSAPIAALLTRISQRPWRAFDFLRPVPRTEASSPISTGNGRGFAACRVDLFGGELRRHRSLDDRRCTTDAPSSASRSAMPKPMPCAPPVTTATRPASRCAVFAHLIPPRVRPRASAARRRQGPRTIETSSTSVTSALISGVKPTRIMAQSRSGKVIWSPATKVVIRVSSKERVKRQDGAGHHGGCQMRQQAHSARSASGWRRDRRRLRRAIRGSDCSRVSTRR